jgi:hypothetical protein
MKREDQSSLIENIIVEAAKKVEKPNEKEKALEVLKRFKSPKHKLHVKKHIEKLEKGHAPKKVLKDFFKDLSKVSSQEEVDIIMKEASMKRFNLGAGVTCSLKETKDGQGFEIELKGSFRSGDSIEDTQKQIERFWKTLDID